MPNRSVSNAASGHSSATYADPEFDTLVDRTGTSASKWRRHEGRDVLPFPVADMEFKSPRFVLDAISERLQHGILGYTDTPAELNDAFLGWLAHHYGWQVEPSWLVWLTGVVPGLNVAARAVGGGSILIPTPVYYPFLAVPGNTNQRALTVPAVRDGDRWVMDFDALRAAIEPDTKLLLLCNPQNPTGRVFQRDELETLATLAEAHDLIICSDEIHCGLVIDPAAQHHCLAALSAPLAARTISLFAATKTYNIAGLGCGVAVIPDRALRKRFIRARAGMISSVGPLAYAASTAAFADRSNWVPRLNRYLHNNSQRLASFVADLPGVAMTPVEGTYLAWLDVRELALPDPAAAFEAAGLALSDGAAFGGPGYLRFNFACPRPLLERGLERLGAVVKQLS